ncbi:unnamed protein product [Cladocopium goreaui]|uniref:Dynein heavy chain 7, axonemal n=1 Tax=Cladocopium goreaui TaxID=2562237 RepID=A0A9P1C455_9DINO|nr:unnamed protein product [Cladocopium goreaui]
MGPPGGGRNFITPRILGHMYLVGFPLLDDDNMMQIFNTILEWKFRAENYPTEVAALSKKMVQATLEIYKNTSSELRPTPMKVHYTFNLRDFSKVICGVLLLKKNECDGASRHVRLWAHEILRVFGDRLIDDTDREWMMHQLREQTKKNFQVSFDEIMIHLDVNKDGKVNTLDEVRTLFFGDMLSPASIPQRPYTECPDVAVLQKEIEAHLVSYNEMSSKPMDLVCFLYMLEHLARVARVIKSPGGNALLVGLGGSGRQSCTRLACYMADFTVFQIEIAKGYDMSAFREDMKKMLTKAGGNEERTIFLFSDTQIKDEGFVEDVNNLLNTGEIPNLFPAEETRHIVARCLGRERVAVCEMVRKAAADEGKAPAEREILKLQRDQVAFALACSQSLQDATLPMEVRHMAVCLLKNVLPAAAHPDTAKLLRAAILQALDDEALCCQAALCAGRLWKSAPWPELVPAVLALGQRGGELLGGHVVSALKVMQLLAEEGCTDAEMTEAALAALRAPISLQVAVAALQALAALLPAGTAAHQAATLSAALHALDQSQLRLEAYRLLEVCVSESYNVISIPALQQLVAATQTSIAGDSEEEALAAQELTRGSQGGLLRQAAPMLLPPLLEALQRKPTDPGWTLEDHLPTLSESACECLMAVSKVLGDELLQPVLGFVSSAMASQEIWHRRAALLAFGAIQEGPAMQTLQPLIRSALPRLLEALKAQELFEASAAAWALGRLLDVNPAAVPDESQAALFEVAVLRLRFAPSLAEELCYCLNGIVDQQASVLEPQLFGTVVESLLLGAAQAERESRVQLALFGCLCELLGRAGEDCLPQMQLVLTEVLRRIAAELGQHAAPVRSLLRCLRVLLLRNAEINSSQVAELLAGTLHLEPTEEVRCVCCAKVDAVGCLRLDGCQMVGDDE